MDEALDNGTGRARDSGRAGQAPACRRSARAACWTTDQATMGRSSASRRGRGRRHGRDSAAEACSSCSAFCFLLSFWLQVPSEQSRERRPCASNGRTSPWACTAALHHPPSTVLVHAPHHTRASASAAATVTHHLHARTAPLATLASSGLALRRARLHLCPRMLMRHDEGSAARHMCDAVGEDTVKARS